jgi:hypothetical protein
MLKKRLISMLLTIVLVMALSPAGAFAAENVQAKPTASSILLNGVKASLEAYNIKDNNYFKLRDLAKLLNGGAKQFEVTWDASKNAVSILTNHAYTPVGGELIPSGSTSIKYAALSASKVTIDGIGASLTAYRIDGNNYFKLRDVAAVINFEVIWDKSRNTIVITTTD